MYTYIYVLYIFMKSRLHRRIRHRLLQEEG